MVCRGTVAEDFGDAAVGVEIMPWRLEDVLRDRGANDIQGGLFKASRCTTDG